MALRTKTACLFSGGLGSFIGAVDQIEGVGQVALVGHHSAGGGATSRSQNEAIAALRTKYSEAKTPFLRLWVSPPTGSTRESETTTRGRSIMFLGLGVAVACGIGAERLIVPENGLISLNVPLTNSRVGSFSTRTTHPYLMSLVRELLAHLGIAVALELPYRFRTKGEMISECADGVVLSSGLASTMSCSHPGANRFRMRNPNIHCGYCIPCLVRRAAIKKAGIKDPTDYAVIDLSAPLGGQRGSDLRTLKMALDRYGRRPPRVADVLIPGPLPCADDGLLEYFGVFERGLKEPSGMVSSFGVKLSKRCA